MDELVFNPLTLIENQRKLWDKSLIDNRITSHHYMNVVAIQNETDLINSRVEGYKS